MDIRPVGLSLGNMYRYATLRTSAMLPPFVADTNLTCKNQYNKVMLEICLSEGKYIVYVPTYYVIYLHVLTIRPYKIDSSVIIQLFLESWDGGRNCILVFSESYMKINSTMLIPNLKSNKQGIYSIWPYSI